MNRKGNFTVGSIRENLVLSLYLGLCSTLIIAATLNNTTGMGAAVIVVLIISSVVISLTCNITPSEIRIPMYIVTTVTLVKIIQMPIKAYASSLDSAPGVLIPLIVVNCIILSRVEASASKNSVFDSTLDGPGMGFGYTVSTILMPATRQIITTGILLFGNPFDVVQSIFSIRITPEDFAISVFSQSFGALCTFVCLAAGLAAYKSHQQNKMKKLEKEAK